MRFLVVDDHPMFREIVHQYIKRYDEEALIYQADSTDEALALTTLHASFDLIILDVSMPGKSVEKLLLDLIGLDSKVKIAFLSSVECPETISKLMRSGAKGYLSKTISANEFHNALQLLIRGETYVSPKLQLKVKEAEEQQDSHQPVVTLTPRQQVVLALLQEGLPNKEIARKLHCSEGTVKLHVAGILRAFQVNNRTEAVALAIQGNINKP